MSSDPFRLSYSLADLVGVTSTTRPAEGLRGSVGDVLRLVVSWWAWVLLNAVRGAAFGQADAAGEDKALAFYVLRCPHHLPESGDPAVKLSEKPTAFLMCC